MSYEKWKRKTNWYCENCGREVPDVKGNEWHFILGGHGTGVCGECYREFVEMNPDIRPDQSPFWPEVVVNLQLGLGVIKTIKRFFQKVLEPTIKCPINVNRVDGSIDPIPLTQALSFLPWVCPACSKDVFGNNKSYFMTDLGTYVCSRCENRLRTDALYYDDVVNTLVAREVNRGVIRRC